MSIKSWIARKLESWLEGDARTSGAALLRNTSATSLACGELNLTEVELSRERMAASLGLLPVVAGGRVRVRRAFCSSMKLQVPSWYNAKKL